VGFERQWCLRNVLPRPPQPVNSRHKPLYPVAM
jgi:hypothetical protein